MKRFRLRTFIILGLAGLSGAVLLHTSQSVQEAEEKLRVLERSVAAEEEAVKVLNAEWAYLNSPDRLEYLAQEYLDLVPPAPQHITNEPAVLPERPQEEIPTQPLLRHVSGGAQDAIDETPEEPESDVIITPPRKPFRQAPPAERDFQSLLKNLNEGR